MLESDPTVILAVCTAQLEGLDEDILEYIVGVIETSEGEDLDDINEASPSHDIHPVIAQSPQRRSPRGTLSTNCVSKSHTGV